MSVRPQTLSNALMNGTTRCPHCETCFKIAEAQFTAHQGMVRCGHCMQAFDSRPTFIPEPPDSQVELIVDDAAGHIVNVAEHGESVHEENPEAPPAEVAASLEHQIAVVDAIDELTATEPGDTHLPVAVNHLPLQSESVDTPDFSQLAANLAVTEQAELHSIIQAGEEPYAEMTPQAEDAAQDDFEDELPRPVRRRIWLWAVATFVLVVLLLAQSVYFFRISLAAHLPALKPALVQLCSLVNCSVPLPQNAELLSIESSGLEADAAHDNQIDFSALLRNRASYTLAFPVLALTLNDSQDKPLARRFFMPTEYLPADEHAQAGLLSNHEVSIKLHLNTADLRPAGYRLELLYRRD